jgi:hypothetical protein
MYIRRKVFSVLTDEMGEERLYSVNETLFEGYEVEEADERMYATVVDGKLGSEYHVDKKGYGKLWEAAVDKEGNIVKKAPKARKVEGGVVIDRNTGKAVKEIKGATKSEQAAIKAAQKKGLKAYEKELARQKDAFSKSGVAEMKKALRAGAEKAGRSKATLKDAYKNAGKLGKAGMIVAPAALVAGAAAAGRASKRD